MEPRPSPHRHGDQIDNLGRVRWTPNNTQLGNNPVTINITDEAGATITQTFSINVQPDTTAPTVKLGFAGFNPAEVGSRVLFQVQATDNARIDNLELTVGGKAVILDQFGQAGFTLDTAGTITAIAKATDAAGNVKTETFTIDVFDPNVPQNAPKVSFAPDWDNLFTSFRDIKGTVTDPDHNLQSYKVDIAPIGTDNWTNIFTGNQEVGSETTSGVLGKFDPSIISDDSYRIRLTATDTTGLSSSIEDEIDVVSNGLKLGNFTLSFTDLSIPVSGIPINVTRTYDSLNAGTKDDFGYGWRLEFRDTDLRTSLPKDEVYAQTGIRSQAFKEGTKVFITLPGGKRETFTFKPTRDPISAYLPSVGEYDTAIYRPAFVSEKGSTSTLTVANTTLNNLKNGYYSTGGVPFNPAYDFFGNKYILTTKEGIVYEINATTGDLNYVTNPNGNKLTFTDAGITSDTGVSVTFQRDAQGKIVSVTDPLGQKVKYQYDAKGDLIGVTDRESNTTQFKYQQPTRNHFLTEIVDPLGRSGIKTEYNDKGQLISLIDALGKEVALAYDPTNSKQTVTDALGNPTTYVYDARGNVVTEVDALGGVITRTYDLENNLLSQKDALGRETKYTYDSFNNKLTETDALGNTTRYTYNSYGQVLTRVNPLGESTRYEYDSRGNRLTLTNSLGQKLNYGYTIQGRPNSITSADGSTTSFIYDNQGNVTSQTDALGRVTSYTYDRNGNQLSETKTVTVNGVVQTITTSNTYDANNRVLTSTDPLGNINRNEYDALGQLKATIDPLGRRTEYVYDTKGQQTEIKYADGTSERTEYDAKGQQVKQIDALGRVSQTIYDALGRQIESILPDDTPNDLTDNPRFKTTYDLAGQVLFQLDERGNRTEFKYDLAGRRTETKDALNNVTTFLYDNAGYRTAETDARGNTTRYQYDKIGRPTKTIFADGTFTLTEYNNRGLRSAFSDQAGNTTFYIYDKENKPVEVIYADNTPNTLTDNPRSYTEYDELGRVTARIDENGNRTEMVYDKAGRLIEERSDCACRRMNYTYDALGNRLTQTDQLGNVTRFEYDVVNRPFKTIFADGTFTQETYDSAGQLTAKTDQNGYKTSYEYDAQGRLKAVIDALNNRTEYSYDISGNLKSVKDANNRTTSNEYDALNRRVATILPLGQRSTMTYDPVGNMSSLTNANGEIISYEYDKLNRLSKKILPDETFTMTYAAIGKMASVTDSRGTTTYSYDVRQRLTEQKEPDGKFLRYGYDGVGNRTILTTPSGTTTFTYDKYNQLATVSDPTGNLTTYTYDKAGNLTQTVMPNSVLETRSYDTLNRLTKIESKKDSTVLFSAAYTLDNAGMRTRVVETGRTVDYTYDKDYRLLSENDGVSTNAYTYDPTGNRLTKTDALGTATYIYDANDRLLTDGTTTYSYDANGNKKTETKAGVTTTYTWDAESRLKGSQSGNTNTVYDYDLGGIRVPQSVNGVETKYLVDKNRNYAQVIEEYNSLGVQASYIYGNDLISQSRNGVDSFYGYDGLGSTRVLTDEVGGVTDKYTYDAYGRILKSTGTTQNNYLYAGEQFDRDLNQYYLRDRYYGTDIGRFSQRDRFEGDMMQPLSMNRYGYTHGNPVNAIDPSGMSFWLVDPSTQNTLLRLQAFQAQIAFSNLARAGSILEGSKALVAVGTSSLSLGSRIGYGIAVELLKSALLYQIKEELYNFISQYKIPIYLPGYDIPETTQHIYDAITGSGGTLTSGGKAPFFLQRTERYKGTWYNDEPPCLKLKGDSKVIPPEYKKWTSDQRTCDEFPFATTKQGGYPKYLENKVSLRPVPSWEQSAMNGSNGQGDQIRIFYDKAKVESNHPTQGWFITFPFFGDISSFIDRSSPKRQYFYKIN